MDPIFSRPTTAFVCHPSAQAIAQFKELGLTPVLLTGDNAATAKAIAAQIGVDEVIPWAAERSIAAWYDCLMPRRPKTSSMRCCGTPRSSAVTQCRSRNGRIASQKRPSTSTARGSLG